MLPLASQWRSRSSASPHRQKLSAGRGYSTLGPMQQQQPTRLQETLSKIPLCTTLTTLLCLILQLCVVILGWNVNLFSISYAAVVYDHEYYRLFTSAYFHLGLFHIAMNMLSFVGIGAWLEMRMGTMYFFLTILWSTILTNSLYIGICSFLAAVTNHQQWLFYASAGFSGVIFTLAVLESHSSPPNATRSIMGMCQVPARAYPWVLLIIIQLLLPRISFVGHLSGLLIGVLQSYGCLAFLFPSSGNLNRLERSPAFACMTRCPQYMLCPDESDHVLPRGVDVLQCCPCSSRASSSPRRFVGSGVSGTAAGSAGVAGGAVGSLPSTVQNPPTATVAAGATNQASPTRLGGAGGWSRLGDSGRMGGEEDVEIAYDGQQVGGEGQRQMVL